MKLFAKTALIASGMGLLLMTGCQGASDSVKSASDTVKEAAPAMSPAAIANKMDALKGMTGLTTVVSNTKAAVQKGDFAAAKAEFGKFEGVWKSVEDGVKKKSPAAYDGVEKQMETVTSSLKGASPDKAAVLTALQGLGQQIASAAKP
jgi:hypothetical protein